MNIKIVRYYKDNDYYAKIRVFDCGEYIAFKVRNNLVTDNGYGIYIDKLLPLDELLFDVKSQLRNIPDSTFVYTNEVILMNNSMTQLQIFIQKLISEIQLNYHMYIKEIEFEKECVNKWLNKEIEEITYNENSFRGV